jgi:hypothetical protein
VLHAFLPLVARIHDDGNDGSSVSDDTVKIRDETRRVDKAPMDRKSPWDGKAGKGSRGGESLMAASRANGMAANASVVEGTDIGDSNVVHKANMGAGTRFCRAASGDGIKQNFATHVGRARGAPTITVEEDGKSSGDAIADNGGSRKRRACATTRSGGKSSSMGSG